MAAAGNGHEGMCVARVVTLLQNMLHLSPQFVQPFLHLSVRSVFLALPHSRFSRGT